jgi:hypothetical protein
MASFRSISAAEGSIGRFLTAPQDEASVPVGRNATEALPVKAEVQPASDHGCGGNRGA